MYPKVKCPLEMMPVRHTPKEKGTKSDEQLRIYELKTATREQIRMSSWGQAGRDILKTYSEIHMRSQKE